MRAALCLSVLAVGAVHGLRTPPIGRSYTTITRVAVSPRVRPLLLNAPTGADGAANNSPDPVQVDAVASTAPESRRRSVGRPLLIAAALIALTPFYARHALSGAKGLWAAYEAAALARPIITKSATSGVAYFLGDAIAQIQSSRDKSTTSSGGSMPWWRRIERGRIGSATVAGAASHGPQLHYWTVLMEASGLPLAAKVALDQTVFSLYLNAAFCVSTELMQRRPLRAALSKARAAAWPCLSAGWKFWPFAHALTYSVVPLHLRVLWVDVLEVAWVAILSSTVARSKAKAMDECAVAEEVCELPSSACPDPLVCDLDDQLPEGEEPKGVVTPSLVTPSSPIAS